MKTFLFGIYILSILIASSVSAGEIASCEWDAGTGTSTTAIRGGYFTDGGGEGNCPSDGACWEVYSDDGTVPDDRNYLRLKMSMGGGGSDWLYGGPNLGNPATLYIRLWMRYLDHDHSQPIHPNEMRSCNSYTCNQIYLLRFVQATASGNTSLNIAIPGGNQYTWYNTDLVRDQWYRLEYKISGAGGSSASIEVRIDGVDRTDEFMKAYAHTTSLVDDNGSLSIGSINYFALNVYDTTAYPNGVLLMDVAGLKLADDDWIGGDEETGGTCIIW